jgi:SseB protein N-terminal domain
MSLAADSNTAARAADPAASQAASTPASHSAPDIAVEQALAAAAQDAGRIGELLDALRSARLWLPLPEDGRPVVSGGAVTLPTVSYLGSEFVPAYSSAQLLEQFGRRDSWPEPPPAGSEPAHTAAVRPTAGPPSAGPVPVPAQRPQPLPHVVVRAADLARLLPPAIGIALNAGAAQSVPVYPQGVSYLAAGDADEDAGGLSVEPLPVRPDPLLAAIAAGLMTIPAARDAVAAWLAVRSAGEGLLIAVTLADPADPATKDMVVGAIERAAWEVEPDQAAFPIDVTFPGEREGDRIDDRIAAVGTPFYRRADGPS